MADIEHRDVLLIEDNAANVLVATEFLKSFNYSYVVANDGLDGIEKTKLFSYSVILMDIQMPGLSGVETAQRIKDMEEDGNADGKRTPIVAMTANYATSDLNKWHAVGIEDVVPKPFNVNYFAKVLARYCKK